MDSLVYDKQTYEPLKRDPTTALQRRLNGKLLDLKKTETIDIQLYYRLGCCVPQSAKLYGLPEFHKSDIPMRPIVILWVFYLPTFQTLNWHSQTIFPMIFNLMVNFKPGNTWKTIFFVSDTGGSEEKIRSTFVIVRTAFLKIIILHQKRRFQSDPIRNPIRSDPIQSPILVLLTATSTTTSPNTAWKEAPLSTGTLLRVLPTVPTAINELHSKPG